MMIAAKFILAVGLFTSHVAYADLDAVDLQWKARGIQAQERLKKLAGKKKKTDAEACTEHFEAGFAEHANPKVSADFKKDAEGHRFYYLRLITPVDPKLSDGEDQLVMTVMGFDYDKTGDLKGSSLAMVAKGWSIVFLKDTSGFMMADHKCKFMIYPDEPLESKAREK